jgi:hypothetical protein
MKGPTLHAQLLAIGEALKVCALEYASQEEIAAVIRALPVSQQREHFPLAVFRFGRLTIRCNPTREAIQCVAAKYAKGSLYRAQLLPRPLTFHRPKDSDAVLAALTLEIGDTTP